MVLREALPEESSRRDTRKPEFGLLDTDELILQARKRAELRKLLLDRGYEPLELPALKAIVLRCPDVDLALTALTMIPRPRWVLDLVAPEHIGAPAK